MRAVLIAGFVMGTLAAGAGLRAAGPDGGPPVVIDVAVFDAAGRPLTALAAGDFHVTLNGRPAPVRSAVFLDARTPVIGRPIVSSHGGAPVRRVMALAIDDLSLSSGASARWRAAAARFVAAVPRSVWVGLSTTSGRVSLTPTEDRTAVATALETVTGTYRDPRTSAVANAASISLVEAIEMVEHNNQAVIDRVRQRECGDTGRGPVGTGLYANAVANYNEACANEAMRAARTMATEARDLTDRQVAGLVRVFDGLAMLAGVKQVVIVSAGIATTRPVATVRPVARAASRAATRLAVVTEDGDAVDLSESGHTLNDLGAVTYATGVSSRQRDDHAMWRGALQALAALAGGTVDVAIGDGDAAFAHASQDGVAVYRLTLDRVAGVTKTGDADVDVAVAQPGTQTRFNRLAVADALGRATAGRGDDLPMRLAVVRRQGVNGAVELGVGLAVDGTAAGPLSLTATLIGLDGRSRSGTRTVPAAPDYGATVTTLPMSVEPGVYTLRASVVDAGGRAGRVETSIEARLSPAGHLRVSDLLTWGTDAAGRAQLFALDDVPPGVTAVWAGLELSAPTGEAVGDPRVSVSVSPLGSDQAIYAADAVLRAVADRSRAEARLPVAQWAPGPYLVTMTVHGRDAATASAVIRVGGR